MKYSQYIAYFKTCAINHKVLAHVENTHHTFYEIDIENILNGMKLKNLYTSMLVERPEVRVYDEKSDNIRKIITGAFVILKEAKMGDFLSRENAMDECEEIASDIVSKLLNDTKKTKQSSAYTPRVVVDSNSIKFQPIGPILTNHYGWRVEFAINSTFNIGLHLDINKWNNETPFNI